MNGPYVRDAWYVAAWASELRLRAMFSRRLLDLPVLMMRRHDGTVAAIADQCPHRFAPLSRGSFDGQNVTCCYHGLGFNGEGRCVRNPHGTITPRFDVRAFPAVERYDRIWLWFGEPVDADPALIPDLNFAEEQPASAREGGYMHVEANWLLIIDNLLDVSHADYVHPALGGFITAAQIELDDRPNGVRLRLTAENIEPPLVYKSSVPEGRADLWLQTEWECPSHVLFDTNAVPAGTEPRGTMWTIHDITPETETTSHYFFAVARNFETQSEEFTTRMAELGRAAFVDEDKPIIEAQQRSMGTPDLFSLHPVFLPGDRAATLARRKIQQQIEASKEKAA